MLKQLNTIFTHRNFIYGSVRQDLAIRYKKSIFGVFWLILQPLSTILVYTIVFSQVMQPRLPDAKGPYDFSIFLCSGLLTWALFADILNRSQSMFTENANLLKKLNFPRICIPVIEVTSATLTFCFTIMIFFCFLIILGHFPGFVVMSILPIIALQIALAASLGLTLGVLNVFFRDIGHALAVILQFWFWLTPIVYPLSIIPKWAQAIVNLNPMTAVVIAYQNVFTQGSIPSFKMLLPTFIVTLLTLFASLMLYSKKSNEMVDEL